MAPRLLLDLGDLLGKGLLLGAGPPRRFGFPSVVASRLIEGEGEPAALVTDAGRAPPRPGGFDPAAFPRLRSFPEAAGLAGASAVPGARYAGWLAATRGVDRRLLGDHPTAELVDALVRKAIMKSGVGDGDLELVLLVDVGAKAAAIASYAAELPRPLEFLRWTVAGGAPDPVRVRASARLLDGPLCALAALPAELAVERVGRLLLIDVGYLRTKLAILSPRGCERQEQVDAAGVSTCVARILRDGQEVGLFEDEIAVVKALERSHQRIEVAGRRFEVVASLADAGRALAEDLARAVSRLVIGQYQTSGDACHAAAIVGGGAALIGERLAERLAAADLGFRTVWVATDTRFHHLAGAARLLDRGG